MPPLPCRATKGDDKSLWICANSISAPRGPTGANGGHGVSGIESEATLTESGSSVRGVWLGVALVAIGSLAFGFMAYFGDLAREGGASTPTLLALRFLIASVCLWGIVLFRRVAVPRGRTRLMLVGLGAGCYFAEAVCYFHGLEQEHTSSGTIALLLYTYPAVVSIAAWSLGRERATALGIVALAIAVIGTGLTVADALRGSMAGILLGLGCSAAYAFYILASDAIPKSTHPLASSTIVVTGAAASLSVYAIAMGPQLPRTPTAWLAVGALAMVCTVLAISAILAGLARIGPVRTSTIATIEPLATVVVGVLLLGERLGPWQVVGGAMILLGAGISARAHAPAKGGRDQTSSPTVREGL